MADYYVFRVTNHMVAAAAEDESIQWVTAGDDRVCEDCAPLDGQVFSSGEYFTEPPIHAQCRCELQVV